MAPISVFLVWTNGHRLKVAISTGAAKSQTHTHGETSIQASGSDFNLTG